MSSQNPQLLARIKGENEAVDPGAKIKKLPFKKTISQDNWFYYCFDVAVGIFMLFTSYYYGFLAANRFHLINRRENDEKYD